MNKRYAQLLTFTFCFLLFFSCKNSIGPIITPEEEPPDILINVLIPTNVGNYWVYTDSTQLNLDTVSIVAKLCSLGFDWRKLRNQSFAMRQFGDEFATRNDTIFSINFTFRGYTEIYPAFFFPKDSSITYYYISGCFIIKRTATLYKNKITVPAGTFQEYVCFVDDWGSRKDSLLIVPGIGVVCSVYECISIGGIYTQKSFLKNYYIKRN